MISESIYGAMKSRIPEVKQLFQSRHYVQCATLCERYLNQSREIHPVHEAYLHFYLALSHDTIAREAGHRNRPKVLELAEKHYLAAISALTPPPAQKLDNIQEYPSPTSSHSDGEGHQRHASDSASLHSQHSTSTSATSVGDDDQDSASDCEPTPRRLNDFVRSPPSGNSLDNFTMSSKLNRRRPSPIKVPRPRMTPQQDHFYYGLSSFVEMIKTHLAGVRELREAPNCRYSFSRSRGSSVNSRTGHSDRSDDNAAMDEVRWSRQSISFRPRFDPSSVQQLCNDALAEL